MTKGHQQTKFIPHHAGAEGNLPPVGQGVPGVSVGGTQKTSTSNSSGMVSGGSGGSGGGKSSNYKAPGANFSH